MARPDRLILVQPHRGYSPWHCLESITYPSPQCSYCALKSGQNLQLKFLQPDSYADSHCLTIIIVWKTSSVLLCQRHTLNSDWVTDNKLEAVWSVKWRKDWHSSSWFNSHKGLTISRNTASKCWSCNVWLFSKPKPCGEEVIIIPIVTILQYQLNCKVLKMKRPKDSMSTLLQNWATTCGLLLTETPAVLLKPVFHKTIFLSWLSQEKPFSVLLFSYPDNWILLKGKAPLNWSWWWLACLLLSLLS